MIFALLYTSLHSSSREFIIPDYVFLLVGDEVRIDSLRESLMPWASDQFPSVQMAYHHHTYHMYYIHPSKYSADRRIRLEVSIIPSTPPTPSSPRATGIPLLPPKFHSARVFAVLTSMRLSFTLEQLNSAQLSSVQFSSAAPAGQFFSNRRK